MTKISCLYIGDLKCKAIHLGSGNQINTDAPLDHCGKGENFSPTDLFATSLGTCLITIMAIKAKGNGWELENIHLNIEKIMSKNEERKIKELILDIYVPEKLSKKRFEFIKEASKDCPVTRNLSETLKVSVNWHYKLQK